METDTVSGLGPPLYENQTLVEAEIGQGQRVIVEDGNPPRLSQVTISNAYIHTYIFLLLSEVFKSYKSSLFPLCT